MTKILYIITIVLLFLSIYKDKEKTKQALLKGWNSFNNILPLFLAVLVFVGLIIAIFSVNFISKFIGDQSGWYGTIIAAFFGTFVMIPSFIALPMAQMLIDNGAGYMQIGAFISTLFMVQLASVPIEMKYLGKKITIVRNLVAFLFSFFVAYVISLFMG